jgi:hypothetical protein
MQASGSQIKNGMAPVHMYVVQPNQVNQGNAGTALGCAHARTPEGRPT